MRGKKKRKVEQINFKLIMEQIEGLEVSKLKPYFKKNLTSYLSSAQRLALYFGNLRTKYVTFNFTLIALFASISALYISSIANINLNLVSTGLPLLFGLGLYFIILMIPLLKKYTTMSFAHSDLIFYSSILSKKKYPKQILENLDGFTELFKGKTKEVLIKNDLKTLLLQYFHQVNHDKVAHKLRRRLTWGIFILIISMSLSFFFLSNPSLLGLLLSSIKDFFNLPF